MSYRMPRSNGDSPQNQAFNGNYSNPSDMPVSNPKKQALLWQQDNYMAAGRDSGFQSEVATRTPSVSGIDDDMLSEPMANDTFEWDQNNFPPNFTQGEVNEMNQQLNQTRSQRIRAAMYPETLEEGTEIPSTHFNQNQPTAVQKLAEPSQMLKSAVDNLINYQEDAGLATRAVPDLIKLLNDEDRVVVSHAASMVHQLSKLEASRHALFKSPQMVTALLRAMSNSADLETAKCAAGTIHNLSLHQQGLLSIFKSGGIPALVELLGSPIESVLFYAVTTLHNLLLHQDGTKLAVKNAGGIKKMIALLPRNNVKFLAIVTDCLQILTYADPESKLLVLANQGLAELVRIIKSYNYEKLLLTTTRLLKVLSVCQKCKLAIVESGGMQAMGLHLGHGNHRLVQNCLWTLRNLSDAGTKEKNIELLLQQLVHCLASKDVNVVTCATGILSNLTCNNQANKITICQNHGIPALIYTIVQAGDCEEVIEPSICALRHLTSRHPQAEQAQNDIRIHNGLQPILCLLQPPVRWPIVKAVIGLIRNMSLSSDNHQYLREFGAIHHLIQLLFQVNQIIQQHRGSLTPNEDISATYVDGVKMEELIESTIGALQILASDDQNWPIFRESSVVRLFVQFLYSNVVNIQKVSAAIMSELAVDKDIADIIDREGGKAPLNELMQSQNEALASHATSLMMKLCNWSPHDQRKRLSLEFTHSLLPDVDGQNWVNGDLDLCTMLPNDPYNDSLYSASGGPPSVHSNMGQPSVHNNGSGRNYSQPSAMEMGGPGSNYGVVIDGEVMDIDIGRNGAFEFDHDSAATDPAMGTPPHLQQIGPSPAAPQMTAWYDTDL